MVCPMGYPTVVHEAASALCVAENAGVKPDEADEKARRVFNIERFNSLLYFPYLAMDEKPRNSR